MAFRRRARPARRLLPCALVVGVNLVMLAFVATVCATIGLAGTHREDGLAAPAGIGLVAGLLSAATARALGLPSILPVTVGALVVPAVWTVSGAAVIVTAVRLLSMRHGGVR